MFSAKENPVRPYTPGLIFKANGLLVLAFDVLIVLLRQEIYGFHQNECLVS